MSVLLTGGTGFVGSHTAVELINAGYDVVIADNLSNSSADVVDRIGRITGVVPPLYVIDVADKTALNKLFDERSIDAVIHFAGYKAVGESVARPLMYYRNNLDTALSLLETMEEHGTRIFVFSSSATVYGDPETVPIDESSPAGSCSNPYGRTKYFVEKILSDAAAADPDLSVVLLRYFNPIGAHESGLIGELPSGIPNNLMACITQAAAGILEQLSIYGADYPTPDGTGVRDYIHVSDLAAGHVAALRYAQDHKGCEAVNLGAGRGFSVLEVVRAFEETTGVHVPRRFAPRRAGDIAMCYAGTEKALKVLGWRAEKSLEDMCRDAWRWQRNCGPGTDP
ncbi:MAG: UDP-glucose 4-epimerase GalE [Clostridiales bacterium]|nr:UDP-glucose 4-epimerase GalE [Clostridiales bacterium]